VRIYALLHSQTVDISTYTSINYFRRRANEITNEKT
jgi:hypothetical protein